MSAAKKNTPARRRSTKGTGIVKRANAHTQHGTVAQIGKERIVGFAEGFGDDERKLAQSRAHMAGAVVELAAQRSGLVTETKDLAALRKAGSALAKSGGGTILIDGLGGMHVA